MLNVIKNGLLSTGRKQSATRNLPFGNLLLMAFLFVGMTAFSQGSVSGRCTDKSGVPLKGVQVTTVQFDERHTTETNGDGFYEDKQLNPGEWTVIFVYREQKIVKKISTKNGQSQDLNVIFTVGDKQ